MVILITILVTFMAQNKTGISIVNFLEIPQHYPDSKVHRANMGPIWGRQDPGGPHVGPMNFAIWVWLRVLGHVSTLLMHFRCCLSLALCILVQDCSNSFTDAHMRRKCYSPWLWYLQYVYNRDTTVLNWAIERRVSCLKWPACCLHTV